MIVQVNTDHNIKAGEGLREHLTAQITDELSHYSSHITRIEVHLTDEAGEKHGKDKRCVMEARVEHKSPIAVTNHATTNNEAVSGAIDKLKSALEKVMGKEKNHHHAVPEPGEEI